jgi:hypothetical protein
MARLFLGWCHPLSHLTTAKTINVPTNQQPNGEGITWHKELNRNAFKRSICWFGTCPSVCDGEVIERTVVQLAFSFFQAEFVSISVW